MTTENGKRACPTCERRLSERHCYWATAVRTDPETNCPDPCHDVADAGLQLLEALDQARKKVDALILATPTGDTRNALTEVNIVLLTALRATCPDSE